LVRQTTIEPYKVDE